MRRPSLLATAPTVAILLASWQALARHGEEGPPLPETFAPTGPSVGGATPGAPTAASLAGSRIAALDDGALVIDSDSGSLVRTDASGTAIAQLAIGHDAGVLTYDPAARLAYVADRRGDRIVAVRVPADRPTELAVAATWRTPAEPYGVALTPDRATLLVSTIADRALVAYDVATTTERWRVPLAREPRGLAISPDGTRALVAHLGAGVVEDIDLHTHDLSTRAVAGGDVRSSFAVQFLGTREAVVPFQRSVPASPGREIDTGHYGGSEFSPPVTPDLAFLSLSGARTASQAAQIGVQQPRALAWDDARDALYIAGMGTDSLFQLRHASQIDTTAGATANLTLGGERCGPDGVAIAPHGDVLVWCSFSRRVERIVVTDKGRATTVARSSGPAIAPTALTPEQHDGMVVFHIADSHVSTAGAVACAGCHPEGRADGLSWLIEGRTLQTPMLAGRLVGTAPFKWDGGAHDLRHSLVATVTRLGGDGMSDAHLTALVAYLEQLPAVRTPTRPRERVARGKALFESSELGCASCHDGPAYTDQSTHRLAGTLQNVDTPSLLGLAASAPYFHDGSAPTIESLLRDRGGVHGMADSARTLDDGQVADLAAFLDSL